MLNLQIGNTIENVTSQLALHQTIDEPTHILPNSFSCVDLIFTSQPNMVIESGIHSSLYPVAIIRLLLQNLISKYVTHHHIQEKSGRSH